jgi:CHAD domain-containing protein
MKEKRIKKILNSQTNEIAQLAKAVGHDFNKKAIHDLRVTVKSLRSFLRFLSSHDETAGHKISGKLKRIYHIAGGIRDAQLELGTITERKLLLPVYSTGLNELISTRKKEWERHFSKKTIGSFNKGLLNHKFDVFTVSDLHSFFSNKMTAIEALSNIRLPSDDQVHKIRKLVKDILYNATIAHEKWPGASDQVRSLPEKELNAIADMIGDYNNRRNMLNHLTGSSSETMEMEEKKTIKMYCNEEIKSLRAAKKTILGTVQLLIKKLNGERDRTADPLSRD